MKKPKVIYQNKVDNNNELNLDDQKFDSATRSRSPVVTGSASLYSLPVGRARSQNQHFWSSFNLVLRRLIHNKKEKSVLDLYSHFLQPLVRRRSISGHNNKYIKRYINNSRNLRIAGITSSFLLVLLSISILTPIHSNITNVEATSIGTKAESVLNITSSNNIAAVDLLVKDSNGTFASSDDSGNTLDFSVTTDNSTGYTLSIVSPSDTVYNDGKLTNADTKCSTNCTLSSINSASNTISTNGTWGYKPSKLNSVANNNYLPSPTTTATILDKTTTANTTGIANSYSIAIGAKADYTQIPGVYSNTYALQATSNVVIIYMQDVSKDDLSILLPNTGDTTTLYDNRDNQAYTVGKLADGNYWLLDNLTLDLTNADVQKNLSSDTTNATDTEIHYLLNGGGTASDRYPTGQVSSDNVGNVYSEPQINTNYKDTTTTGTYQGKIGIYYNYCAASAGSYCYGNDEDPGTPSGNAKSDICPSGWRMPFGGSQGEYRALYTAYSSNYTSFRSALHLLQSGFYNFSAGTAYRQNSAGFFWSSKNYDEEKMYALDVDNNFIYVANSEVRYSGLSVRCIFDISTINSIDYLQEVTPEIAENTTDLATTRLTDRRDGNTYNIKKINGRLWMTQNLRIKTSAGQTEGVISSTDSNFSTNNTWNVYAGDLDKTITTSDYSTYTEARSHYASSNSYGAWYNYCAATAGTICDSSNTLVASEDICPAGWQMPTTSDLSGILSYKDEFKPVFGGYYYNGTLMGVDEYGDESQYRGYHWSANKGNNGNESRWFLFYSGGASGTFSLGGNGTKSNGFYIRCISKN